MFEKCSWRPPKFDMAPKTPSSYKLDYEPPTGTINLSTTNPRVIGACLKMEQLPHMTIFTKKKTTCITRKNTRSSCCCCNYGVTMVFLWFSYGFHHNFQQIQR